LFFNIFPSNFLTNSGDASYCYGRGLQQLKSSHLRKKKIVIQHRES
jgi:hypothetical protein